MLRAIAAAKNKTIASMPARSRTACAVILPEDHMVSRRDRERRRTLRYRQCSVRQWCR